MSRRDIGRLTIAQAKAIVKPLGFSLNRTSAGDFRLALWPVASPAAAEADAYYTDDLADAVATACHIYQSRAKGEKHVQF